MPAIIDSADSLGPYLGSLAISCRTQGGVCRRLGCRARERSVLWDTGCRDPIGPAVDRCCVPR